MRRSPDYGVRDTRPLVHAGHGAGATDPSVRRHGAKGWTTNLDN